MNYKIVNNRSQEVFAKGFITEELAKDTIAGTPILEKEYHVVPSHYQWLQSVRNNDYRWMELPFDNQ